MVERVGIGYTKNEIERVTQQYYCSLCLSWQFCCCCWVGSQSYTSYILPMEVGNGSLVEFFNRFCSLFSYDSLTNSTPLMFQTETSTQPLPRSNMKLTAKIESFLHMGKEIGTPKVSLSFLTLAFCPALPQLLSKALSLWFIKQLLLIQAETKKAVKVSDLAVCTWPTSSSPWVAYNALCPWISCQRAEGTDTSYMALPCPQLLTSLTFQLTTLLSVWQD